MQHLACRRSGHDERGERTGGHPTNVLGNTGRAVAPKRGHVDRRYSCPERVILTMKICTALRFEKPQAATAHLHGEQSAKRAPSFSDVRRLRMHVLWQLAHRVAVRHPV